MAEGDDTPERMAFEEALRVVIAERDQWRIAGKFAVEAFEKYLERVPPTQVSGLHWYRQDVDRAVEELQRVLKLSTQ